MSKMLKRIIIFFFCTFFVTHTFLSRQFLRTTRDTVIVNSSLEPLRPVDLTFGSL